MTLTRRDLARAALGALAAACSRRESPRAMPSPPPSPSAPPEPPPSARVIEWDVDAPWGRERAAVVVPEGAPAGSTFPLLVALHGRGEAVKPKERGALGWPRDYELVRAIGRLAHPPLTRDDFEGFVEPARLTKLNAELATQPYRGLVVVCPHVPDMGPNDAESVRNVSKLVIDALLPRARAELPVMATPEATGIDGVSMGGALALRVGLTHPEAFGAVGGTQAAIDEGHVEELTELARAAIARRPSLTVRLLTSHDDYFREALTALSASLTRAGVAHDFADVPGPHDYVFNKGPGSIELASYYDRALRR